MKRMIEGWYMDTIQNFIQKCEGSVEVSKICGRLISIAHSHRLSNEFTTSAEKGTA